ncbi:MAG: 3-dehydroquinate synthase [Candidatus Thorarchaeota archaeon]|jgi:3-dehydroquinate synthase
MTYVTFDVKTKTREYPVHVGQNILGSMYEFMDGKANRVFVMTDDVVSKLHLEPLLRGLTKSDVEVITRLIPSGENYKTLETALMLYDFLLDNHASRSDSVLALGGGVVGDLAGFVTSTFKRGMRLIQVPTTLLAQVDSALGGKTGVNLPAGKNLVGTFYQPHLLVADVCTLKTLSENDFAAGLAEVIKYGLIMDQELIVILENNRNGILKRESESIALIVERCLRNKARVVEEDEREERGRREILNFGHTIGHALETVSEHHLQHGMAVAMGMVEEARLAVKMGFLDNQSLDSLIALLSMFGLPTDLPSDVDVSDLDEIMKQDKKLRYGQLTIPVLVGLGETEMKVVESLYKLN